MRAQDGAAPNGGFDLRPKINAYIGILHERLLAGTRRLARAQGQAVQSTMAVIGFGFSL